MIDFVSVWSGAISNMLIPMALTVTVLWLVELPLRFVNAKYRSWLWRLFFVKCAIVLIFPWHVGISYLPSFPVNVAGLSKPTTERRTTDRPVADAIAPQEPIVSSTMLQPGNFTSATIAHEKVAGKAIQQTGTERFWSIAVSNETMLVLFFVWLTCVVLQVTLLIRNYSKSLVIMRRRSRIGDPQLLKLYRTTVSRLGLTKYPALRLIDNANGPALVYCGSINILLPSRFHEQFGDEACCMAFAHELAHYQRRDLVWNLVATLIAVVFFFYPPIWIALCRYRITMESACDELALRATKIDRSAYARLLVSLLDPSAYKHSPIVLTMARSDSFYSLSERLYAMKITSTSRVSRILAPALLCIVSVVLLAPWGSADEPTPTTQRKSSRTQSSSQGMSGGMSSGGFASGSASGNQIGFGKSGVTSNVTLSFGSNADENDRYDRAPEDRYDKPKNTTTIRSSASASAFGGSSAGGFSSSLARASAGSEFFSNNIHGSTPKTTNGDVRIFKSTNKVDGLQVTLTRIVSPKETIAITESDDDGIEVRITKRGQKARDAVVYHADSFDDLAAEHPDVYESIGKHVGPKHGGVNMAMDDGTIPAQQMMLEQLRKALDDARGNPQLESMIQQMIEQNQ